MDTGHQQIWPDKKIQKTSGVLSELCSDHLNQLVGANTCLAFIASCFRLVYIKVDPYETM